MKKYTGRFWFVASILLLALAGLLWRMLDLMIINRTFLQDQGNARIIRDIDIPAYRGMIVDRNGKPLAVSTPVDSVWINPSQYTDDPQDLKEVARLLELPLQELKTKLQTNAHREFMYLKRRINPAIAAQIKALKIPGIYLQREYRRYYPEGEITAHLLGFTNIDDQGQEGLELAYNDWLRGAPGKKEVIKDRLGNIISILKTVKEPQPGQDLVLSIDRRIQYLAYRELHDAVLKYNAKAGSAVVLDAATGEVLAMVNMPSYNPNQRPKEHDGRYRNRAVTDLVEPGSTIKAFPVANALLSGKYTPTTIVDTNPGWMRIEGKTITEDKGHNYGVQDVTGVLRKSSNIGVTKLTFSLPPESYWSLLHKLGFGEHTATGFPGEVGGVLPSPKQLRPITLATMSFGYGLSVTPLQLAQAYGVLASDGLKKPVSLLKVDSTNVKGEQVIDPKVSREVLTMLESVTERGGTGTRAQIPGYKVAGKTGTSRIAEHGGYDKSKHFGLFAGIAPAERPRLVMVVVINDAQVGQFYYGGAVAAPIFSKVMSGALRILDIPPDDVANQME